MSIVSWISGEDILLTNWRTSQLTAAFAAALCAAVIILACASSASAEPMSFSLTPARGVEGCGKRCKIVIVADGDIDNSSPGRFEALIRDYLGPKPRGLTVLLRSPGGFVIAAAKLGLLFRKYRATVAVASISTMNLRTRKVRLGPASCISACVYAFMGGHKRVIPSSGSLMLHRSYADGSWFRGRQYNNDFVRQYILAYAKSMGVSTAPVQFAETLPPSEIYRLTRNQIRGWNLAASHF